MSHLKCQEKRTIKEALTVKEKANDVIANNERFALITGDCLTLLKQMPDESFDCVLTSPPYFNQREYDITIENKNLVIGQEKTVEEYTANLAKIFGEIHRVLTPRGSLWLNLGDKFINKNLTGIPWRVALALKDDGWILRQDIIWNQLKGTQSAKDRMRDVYEHIFHFVKQKSYYFNDTPIRIKPAAAIFKDGRVTSASGVSGKKYYEYIAKSKLLSPQEKKSAQKALNDVITEMAAGKVVDFRMTIRGVQRTYHSESHKISGRAKELHEKGFFIIKMRATGYLPSNIWNIVPEDKWRKDGHCAVFPEELLRIPLLSTCPKNGIVLDPFSGTGTTISAALNYGLRAIGFEISENYNNIARLRICDKRERLLI